MVLDTGMGLPVTNTGVGPPNTGGNIDTNALIKQLIGNSQGGQSDPLLGGIGGLFDLWKVVSGGQNKETQAAINQYAFPRAKNVGEYTDMLHEALTVPGSYKMTPGAEFARDEGLQAVARKGNAMFGGTRAGNTPIELERYATGFAEQNYNNYIQQLTQLSEGNPAAANIFLGGKEKGDQGIAGGLSAIGDLLKLVTGSTSAGWIQKLLGGGGGGGGPGTSGWGTDITGPDITDGGGPGTPGWGSDITGPDMGGIGIGDPGWGSDITGPDLGDLGDLGDIFAGT